MAINKAQGQSLEVAGVDLRNDCFFHGLVILQPEEGNKNIVNKEIL